MIRALALTLLVVGLVAAMSVVSLGQQIAPRPPVDPQSQDECDRFAARYNIYLSGLRTTLTTCRNRLSNQQVTDQVPVACWGPTAPRACVPEHQAAFCAHDAFHGLLAQCRGRVREAQDRARADDTVSGDYRDEIMSIYRERATEGLVDRLLPKPLQDIRDRVNRIGAMVKGVRGAKTPRETLDLGITAASEIYGFAQPGSLQRFMFDTAIEGAGAAGATAIEDAERALRAFDDKYDAADNVVPGATIDGLGPAPVPRQSGGGQSRPQNACLGAPPSSFVCTGTYRQPCLCSGGTCRLGPVDDRLWCKGEPVGSYRF